MQFVFVLSVLVFGLCYGSPVGSPVDIPIEVSSDPIALSNLNELKPKTKPKCPEPNGTDSGLYFYNCNTLLSIQLKDATVLSGDEKVERYPVDVTKKLILHQTSFNSGEQIEKNTANVQIHEYGWSWLRNRCLWSKIPTLGLLDGIDGCSYANNCPLKKGQLELDIPVDLARYSRILKYLAGDKVYQLTIDMLDEEQQNIACIVSQFKISK